MRCTTSDVLRKCFGRRFSHRFVEDDIKDSLVRMMLGEHSQGRCLAGTRECLDDSNRSSRKGKVQNSCLLGRRIELGL